MVLTLHGQVTLLSNVLSDVRIARDAGYAALEVHTDKLIRYLDSGHTAEELRDYLTQFGIQAAAIDIIGNLETTTSAGRKELLSMTERLCGVAVTIGAPTIQLNGFCGLDGLPKKEAITLTAANMRAVAAIGREHGLRFQYEGAAWTPIATLNDTIQLIEETGQDNVGLVIDFWHYWACRGAEPEEIARLDPAIIYGVHLCDGFRPAEGDPWVDERELRGALPGDGEIPVQEWVDAIKATGFDGYISGEFLNPFQWERDHLEVATAMRERMESYL